MSHPVVANDAGASPPLEQHRDDRLLGPYVEAARARSSGSAGLHIDVLQQLTRQSDILVLDAVGVQTGRQLDRVVPALLESGVAPDCVCIHRRRNRTPPEAGR